MDTTFLKRKYDPRIKDIEKNMNETTNIKIYINIGQEFNMELIKEKKYSELGNQFTEAYLNIITFGNKCIQSILEEKNIKFFVPFQKPSYDIKEDSNTIEICYYHNDTKYEMMYMEEEEWINVQIIGRQDLEELYVEDYLYIPLFKLKYY